MKKEKIFYLAPDIVLSYILGTDKKIKQMIDMADENVVTSAFCFHEVLSSLTVEEISKNAGTINYLLARIPIVDTKAVIGKNLVQSESRKKHLRSLIK